MATDDAQKEKPDPEPNWFAVAGSAAAWVALGLADIIVTWRMCLHREDFGGPSSPPGARALYLLITFTLLAVTIAAGLRSYRNWRRTSKLDLLGAEGRERPEFTALAGLFISLTLGAGMVWLCLPFFILQLCLRAR